MKRRWIDKYSSEFDNRIINVVHKNAEILNVKPKSIWFIRHLLSTDSVDARDILEEGEICSKGDRERDKPTAKNYEETDEIWSDDEELERPIEKSSRQTVERSQVGAGCDLVNTVVEVNGRFRKVYDYCDSKPNSFNICNDPSLYTRNTVVEVSGRFRKVYDYRGPVTSSPSICAGPAYDIANTVVDVNGPIRQVYGYGGTQTNSPKTYERTTGSSNTNMSPRGFRNIRKDFNDVDGINQRRPYKSVSQNIQRFL